MIASQREYLSNDVIISRARFLNVQMNAIVAIENLEKDMRYMMDATIVIAVTVICILCMLIMLCYLARQDADARHNAVARYCAQQRASPGNSGP